MSDRSRGLPDSARGIAHLLSHTTEAPSASRHVSTPSGREPIPSLIPQDGPRPPVGRPYELPPLPPVTTVQPRSTPPAPRLAGVSSILNPPLSAENVEHGRRRKVPDLGHPLPNTSASLPNAQLGAGLPPASPALSRIHGDERGPRRILTPRSPSATIHRAQSTGQLRAVSRTGSAQYGQLPPSPRNRPRAFDHTHAASHAASQLHEQPRYGYDSHRGTTAPRSGMDPDVSNPPTPFAGYSHISEPSPRTSAAYPPANTHAPINSGEIDPSHRPIPTSGVYGGEGSDIRPFGIPISSSGGQNVYQMMTLETTSGRVQVPVDVQAASRMADEKRRRNAGASARFRQRRKEKEKEASSTISRLEQQVKELGEEVEFYRRDRDHLASVVNQFPGAERHLPRPASPRTRRGPTIMAVSSSSGYGMSPDDAGRGEHGRYVRRRTSTLSLAPGHAEGMSSTASSSGGSNHHTPHTSTYGTNYAYGPAPVSPTVDGHHGMGLPGQHHTSSGLPGSYERDMYGRQSAGMPLAPSKRTPPPGQWAAYHGDHRSSAPSGSYDQVKREP